MPSDQPDQIDVGSYVRIRVISTAKSTEKIDIARSLISDSYCEFIVYNQCANQKCPVKYP